MNKIFLFFLLLASLNLTGQPSSEKNKLIASINENKNQYEESALKIWDWAEVGYQEYKSAEELQRLLKNEGFSLEVGVANIPTAFVATYKNGEGPVIGILGEYDALPGLSQTNEPKKNLRDGVSSGHACGHNLFGVASAASSIAIKKWMENTNTKGTIKFFGCPAEEGGSGKVYMVREGYFENVDIVLNWHPSNSNRASAGSSLANKTGKFRFSGISAHAKKMAVQNDFTTISPIPRSRTGLPVKSSATEITLFVKCLRDSTGITFIDGVTDTITFSSSDTSLRN